jgi:hypothetical protein
VGFVWRAGYTFTGRKSGEIIAPRPVSDSFGVNLRSFQRFAWNNVRGPGANSLLGPGNRCLAGLPCDYLALSPVFRLSPGLCSLLLGRVAAALCLVLLLGELVWAAWQRALEQASTLVLPGALELPCKPCWSRLGHATWHLVGLVPPWP